jgi:hypothetical protein
VNVIVYHPKSTENIRILQKKVAAVNAEAVLRYIESLHCPKEQKVNLLNNVIKNAAV